MLSSQCVLLSLSFLLFCVVGEKALPVDSRMVDHLWFDSCRSMVRSREKWLCWCAIELFICVSRAMYNLVISEVRVVLNCCSVSVSAYTVPCAVFSSPIMSVLNVGKERYFRDRLGLFLFLVGRTRRRQSMRKWF